MKKTVFLDRDGTINQEVNYLYRPQDFRFIPGAPEAIGLLNRHGFQLIVVTNQAGVARGYYTEEDVKRLHCYMNEELEAYGAHIDGFYYCPHHPEHGIGSYKKLCSCRKPEVGMFEKAHQDFCVDKAHSYMVGDNKGDILAGKQFGIASILVGTGYGGQFKLPLKGIYDHYTADLKEAADWIVKGERE